MTRPVSLSTSPLRVRNCRGSLTPPVGRYALGEKLERQWRELRRHATIERDTEKMMRLTAELNKRKQQVEAMNKCKTN